MRGKAQPDGRPALQIIETPFLYFLPLLDQSTRATLTSYCSGKISALGLYKVAKLRTRILLYGRPILWLLSQRHTVTAQPCYMKEIH